MLTERDDDLVDIEIEFPVSFAVVGTPVSSQAANPGSKQRWKEAVAAAARRVVPEGTWLSLEPLSLLIYDFPEAPPQGDVDNIVKLIQDAMRLVIYPDDHQIRRIVAQRFLPDDLSSYADYPPWSRRRWSTIRLSSSSG